jgi:hypothetical protein
MWEMERFHQNEPARPINTCISPSMNMVFTAFLVGQGLASFLKVTPTGNGVFRGFLVC